MRLLLKWPPAGGEGHHENFYVGGWRPSGPLSVEWERPPSTVEPVARRGPNWFIVGNASPFPGGESGLVHVSDPSDPACRSGAVAFSGYLLDPPVHSWSPSVDLLRFWLDDSSREYNGVFSAARVLDGGRRLELVSDLFGMAPLYYRRSADGLVLFSTNPRYLKVDGMTPDFMAWRSLVQSRSVPSDRSPDASIRRAPPRSVLRFVDGREEVVRWFDYGSFPDGRQEVDEAATEKAEGAFQVAMDRCLRLQRDAVSLPLSSGYDSRRIMAALLERQVPFHASTVRIWQRGYRELDAKFAAVMAKALGFPHRVLGPEHPPESAAYASEYAEYDRQRRILMPGEGENHSWIVPLMNSLPAVPTIYLDGVAGDVLGNGGFDVPELVYDFAVDRTRIVEDVLGTEYEGILGGPSWPTLSELRREFLDDFDSLPPGINQGEVAFMLLRTRRAIAIYQWMLPAGHVFVAPYLDIDHVRTMMSFHPGQKNVRKMQTMCITRFQPRYVEFPGSRSIPSEIPPGSPTMIVRRDVECFRRLEAELAASGGTRFLRDLLTRPAGIRLRLSAWSDGVAGRSTWAFTRLMELVSNQMADGGSFKISDRD